MTVETAMNVPAKLAIDGLDSSGNPVSLSFPIARSLPAAAATALYRDLVELGKRNLTPYDRLRPQLDRLTLLAKSATSNDERVRLLEAYNVILNRVTDCIISGRADDLAETAYFTEGRKSVEGLAREIVERAKHADKVVSPQELLTVITTGNAGMILASLEESLGELEDFTVAI